VLPSRHLGGEAESTQGKCLDTIAVMVRCEDNATAHHGKRDESEEKPGL
jgi:hypothetical protein